MKELLKYIPSIKSVNVLLVEDNPADVRLAREALKGGTLKNNLNVVMDGEEALFFLRKTGKYADDRTPDIDIILLDLNLPKKDGREVLAEVKMDPALKHIPVIILTTSAAEQDILETYNNHANCFIIKPVDFDEFSTIIKCIEQFWLSIVKLPVKIKE
jgi:chemotaxis family two-component system response regulator Rcp1